MTLLSTQPVIESFKLGMRQFASGVCLITSIHDGQRAGLVATAVNSVSMEPPTLLICINRSASAFDVVERSGIFCVNVLPVDCLNVAGQFSSSQRREERFQHGQWSELETGAPVLDEAMVSFDCQVVHSLPYHSHTIFLGEVRAVKLREETSAPLLYLDRQYRHVSQHAVL